MIEFLRAEMDRAANILHSSHGKGADAIRKSARDARRVLRAALDGRILPKTETEGS